MLKRSLAMLLVFVLCCCVLCSCSPSEEFVMTVGNTGISAREYEYNYYAQVQQFYSDYSEYLSYFGIDPEKPLKEQPCTVSETEQTWADFFMDQTEDVLKQVFTFYNAAVAANVVLSEESQLRVDAFVLAANEAAASAKMSLNEYLAENYGKGLTEETYREYLSRRILATQYCDEVLNSAVYSDADYEAYYQQNRASIDKVDFRVYTLNASFLPEDSAASTESESAAEVKALADTFADGLTSEEIFRDRAISFAPESEKANYEKDSATLAKNISLSDLANSAMSSWLFDETRASGDVAVHETSSGVYTVCYFLSRYRDEMPLASMRHILLNVTVDKDGNSDDAAVLREITALYDQWKTDGKTESSFIALASANTDDPGSKDTGGLYENFAYGSMVSEINDWLYADGRSAGDSEIIKTSYGYHLVWFAGYGPIAWKSDCVSGLQDADYYELLERLQEENPVTFSENHRESLGNDD